MPFPRQKMLVEVLPILARSEKALASLESVIGPKSMEAATDMMSKPELIGTLGDIIHDHFVDAIRNEGEEVWRGVLDYGDEETFPVMIRECERVFFVEALESDPIEYFSGLEDAKACVDLDWWGDVKPS